VAIASSVLSSKIMTRSGYPFRPATPESFLVEFFYFKKIETLT
jgi:hypothetical protein